MRPHLPAHGAEDLLRRVEQQRLPLGSRCLGASDHPASYGRGRRQRHTHARGAVHSRVRWAAAERGARLVPRRLLHRSGPRAQGQRSTYRRVHRASCHHRAVESPGPQQSRGHRGASSATLRDAAASRTLGAEATGRQTVPNDYVLCTPLRNELSLLHQLVESVDRQQVRPALWLIVDDHSTDGSREWFEARAEQLGWVIALTAPEDPDEYLGGHIARIKSWGLEPAVGRAT